MTGSRFDFFAPAWASWIVLLVAVVGCGSGGKYETHPASGKVVFANGEPMAGGTIIFESEDQQVSARGAIGQDGTFTLGTNVPGDGAVAGWHGTSIMPPAPKVDVDDGGYRSPLDPKYQNAKRSGLRYEVEPDVDNDFTINVTRPAGL